MAAASHEQGAVRPEAELDPERDQIQRLITEVDGLCLDERWEAVVEARDRYLLAAARGHQWWPAAAWAEFRLALDGPAQLAVSVLGSNLSRYTLGPFPEVAASTHSWEEACPYLDGSPVAATFAHECIALGDDLRADESFLRLPPVFDLPAALQPWEPTYGPVRYFVDRVEHDAPECAIVSSAEGPGRSVASDLAEPVDPVDDRPTIDALRAVVQPWAMSLDWAIKAGAFHSTAAHAVRTVAGGLAAEIDPTEALRWVAWLGASGGPSGRRRGMAAGRSALWWLLLQVTGYADSLDDVPVVEWSADELQSFAESVAELRWFTWSANGDLADSAQAGWAVHLALESPTDELCWLLAVEPPDRTGPR